MAKNLMKCRAVRRMKRRETLTSYDELTRKRQSSAVWCNALFKSAFISSPTDTRHSSQNINIIIV